MDKTQGGCVTLRLLSAVNEPSDVLRPRAGRWCSGCSARPAPKTTKEPHKHSADLREAAPPLQAERRGTDSLDPPRSEKRSEPAVGLPKAELSNKKNTGAQGVQAACTVSASSKWRYDEIGRRVRSGRPACSRVRSKQRSGPRAPLTNLRRFCLGCVNVDGEPLDPPRQLQTSTCG